VRIGVTGHRRLDGAERLVEALREQIRWIRDDLVGLLHGDSVERAVTPVRLAVVSQLAEGADRLVAGEVLAMAAARAEEARLGVILPMPREVYVREQGFSPQSKRDFDALLEQASWLHEPLESEPMAEAYQAAGRQLVARADVLIALWDGERSGGKGGTGETLLEATWRGLPCIWIATVGDLAVMDNFRGDHRKGALTAADFYREVERRTAVPLQAERPLPGPALQDDLLKPLRDSFAGLDRFNRGRLDEGFVQRAVAELGPGALEPGWLSAPFARAAELADRYQRRFTWLASSIFAIVTLAAAMLALSISLDVTALAVAEVVFLGAAAVAFAVVRKLELHGRWLSARVLAERLRSAFYVAPTRRDFRRVVGFEAVYIERHSGDWVQRASEEVWDRRPHSSPLDERLPPDQVEAVRARVAGWIEGQIAFHEKNVAKHARRDKRYRLAIVVLVGLAVVFAALDAASIAHEVSLTLAITLPAAGASLGAMLTVAQHRALKERYTKMKSDLTVALRAVLQADENELGPASLDAARIISQESSGWFGTMWFLDIEHL